MDQLSIAALGPHAGSLPRRWSSSQLLVACFSQWPARNCRGEGVLPRLALKDNWYSNRANARTNPMEHISEQCWTRIESLRHRLRSICREADRDELASIDAEMVELREVVFTALGGREEGAPTSGRSEVPR